MRWDALMEGWTARLLADTALVVYLGGPHLYPAQATRPVRVPSVEYLISDDRESELWNHVRVQVDIFAKGMRNAAHIERRIRTLTHRDVGQVLDGERLWMRFEDARTIDFPSQPGVVHRMLEFTMDAARERYTLT
jgi:hypothetical protein